MEADTIEREIFIRAGIERVWSLVSKTGFWIGEELSFEIEAVEGRMMIVDTDKYGRFPVFVVRVDPPTYVAYRWAAGIAVVEPDDANSTLVEFTLEEQPDGVLVRLKESGFSVLADPAIRELKYQENSSGWEEQLGRLRVAGEGAVAP